MLKYKRGYPVAILIGLEKDKAVLWKIFSKVVKPEKTVHINGTQNDPKTVYGFHESIINALRPTLKEGVRSIIIASQARTNYAQKFINHIHEHHMWLTRGPNKSALSKITGSGSTLPQVNMLTKSPEFHKLVSETTAIETENLIEILEKRLNTAKKNSDVLFSLEEVENLILKPQKPKSPKPEYLLLTNKYLASCHHNRLHRLMQIAKNKRVKTRIITAKSIAGKRLTQLGGIVCLTQVEQTFQKQ